MESIKYEHIYLNSENGGFELHEGVRKYIGFYNSERRHTSINNNTLEKYLIQLKRSLKINLNVLNERKKLYNTFVPR